MSTPEHFLKLENMMYASRFIAESVLYNAKEKEIARASGVFVRSKTPLSAKIGYRLSQGECEGRSRLSSL